MNDTENIRLLDIRDLHVGERWLVRSKGNGSLTEIIVSEVARDHIRIEDRYGVSRWYDKVSVPNWLFVERLSPEAPKDLIATIRWRRLGHERPAEAQKCLVLSVNGHKASLPTICWYHVGPAHWADEWHAEYARPISVHMLDLWCPVPLPPLANSTESE